MYLFYQADRRPLSDGNLVCWRVDHDEDRQRRLARVVPHLHAPHGGLPQHLHRDLPRRAHRLVTLNVHTPSHLFSGVCGKFPPSYMGGMMAGQALGGIFPALVNIFVIAMQVTGTCQVIVEYHINIR